MRLFVAIPLSEQLNKYLKEIQQNLPDAKMKISRHIHLTLQFLGNVEPEKLDSIKEALGKISFDPFKVKLSKIGVFKNFKGYIKVVWIGLEGNDELSSLQKQVEENLKPFGFILDKPFSPHLTLARVKFADDKNFENELKKIEVENIEEEFNKVILYQSMLSPKGPEYNELLIITAK